MSLPLVPADPNIEVILAGIMDNVKTVWGYDTGNPGNPWTSWAPIWGGDLTEMVDCKGYWIDMEVAGTLTVEGNPGLIFGKRNAPGIPHRFAGYVYIDSVPATEGTEVSARIDGVEYTTTSVDNLGRYGYMPSIFQVPADDPDTSQKEGGVNGDTIEFLAQVEGNWYLGGTALFEQGAFTTDMDLVVDTTETTIGHRDIPLNEGWNLIGLPLMPADTDIEVVLANIMDNVKTVWNYDLSNPGNPWTSWAPVWGGDLTQMVDCKGYWIDMEVAATLTVEGNSG